MAFEVAQSVELSRKDPIDTIGLSHQWQARQIRSTIEKYQPEYVVSFLTKTNLLTLLACERLPARTIISERNDINRQTVEEPWQTLRSELYKRAHLVTANTKGALEQLSEIVPADRLKFVPNPVNLPAVTLPRPHARHFITASRLVPQKAIDIIIHAFARIAAQVPDWDLHVLGEGPMRADLEALSRKMGLEDRVRFFGFVDPAEHLATAGAYVMASRYEGLPNAVLEAMAFGLPVIASDASPGPLDFVNHCETGLVFEVDNVEQLAHAMLRIASSPNEASAMGHAGRQRIEAFASTDTEAWDHALIQADLNSSKENDVGS